MEWIHVRNVPRGTRKSGLLSLHCLLLVLTACPIALAQRHDSRYEPIDSHKMVILRSSRNPRIDKLPDEGAVDPTLPIRGLEFRFKPSAEQSAALEQLLEDQQNPSSPLYHAWLTPEEFGDRFGLSENNLARVTNWIESQGFHIDSLARSRTWITFSATAGQVSNTFKTPLHSFRVGGRTHFANVADAQIPTDLEPLVFTVTGLDDLPSEGRGRSDRLVNL